MCIRHVVSEDTVSLVSSVTSGSYNPSAPSHEKFSEPCGEGFDEYILFGTIILIMSKHAKHRTSVGTSVTFHD